MKTLRRFLGLLLIELFPLLIAWLMP